MRTIFAAFLAIGMALSSGIVAAQAASQSYQSRTSVTGNEAG